MKILLAIDGSACSGAAVAEVSRRPWPSGSELRIITVVPALDPGFLPGASPTVFDEVVKQRLADATRWTHDAAAVARKNLDLSSVQPMLLEGHPKETIVDEADRWGADLVVLGSHGHGALRRLFLGSVAMAVASRAACSVEIVRCPSGPVSTERAPAA